MPTDPGLLPPQDLDAEQATLGAMLVDRGAVVRGLAIVKPEDFYREAHRTICAAVVTVQQQGNPVDLVTVAAELRRLGKLEDVGGAEYLAALIEQVPTTAHIIRYATIVAEKALLRRFIARCGEAAQRAYEQPEDTAEFLAVELGGLREVAVDATGGKGARPMGEGIPALAHRLEAQIASAPGVVGARTGIGQLDRVMGGLQGWGLIVPRGDTKHGKSLFAGQTALTSAQHFRDDGSGRWVLAYVLEGIEEWEERAVAWLGGFNKMLLEARGRAMDEEENARYLAAMEELVGLPLAATSDLADVGMICADVEAQALQGRKPGLVVIDHFQRTEGGVGDNLTQLLTERAKALAMLSVRMKCPVLVPSQITVNERGERKSMYARGIDQEATVVLDLQRGNGKDDPTGKERGDLWFARSRRQTPWHGKMAWYLDERTGDAHLYDEQDWVGMGRTVADGKQEGGNGQHDRW